MLSTCKEFWCLRMCDIRCTPTIFYVHNTTVHYPSLKRHKCIWQFGKSTGLHELSSFLCHNNFSFLIIASKVELQKSLKRSYICLCLESHPYFLYFVRLFHWCQVWIISAEQLFSTVNRELVSCSGRKGHSAQPRSLRCLPLSEKYFQGIATVMCTRWYTRPGQKD